MDDFAHIVGEDVHFRSRSPPGERGLKLVLQSSGQGDHGRSPSGERGLEYGLATPVGGHDRVAPHPGSVD